MASHILICAGDLCKLFAALLDWERGLWGEKDCFMISLIMCSGPSRITVAYVTEHRYVHLWGTSIVFNSNNAPFKKLLLSLLDKNKKDEAQGQHFSKVIESVNDESSLGLKSKSSVVCLTGGWSLCREGA